VAENFSDEGLDRVLGYIPGGTGTLDTTLYLAAITTAGYQTRNPSDVALDGTKVPRRETVWSTDYQTVAGGTARGAGGEPTIGTGAYARKSMANSEWGAAATNGNGRRRTANQQSFAASTAAWSNPNVIGFAIVTASAAGSGVAYGYANFDDGSTVAVNATGITLQVTPFWQFDI
jgi:hypothetical protein